MKLLLTQGKKAIIDDTDFCLVSAYKFHALKIANTWYAATNIDGVRVYLHHLIVGTPRPGFVVDHRNRNGLDNRRKNLRHVTHAVNVRNQPARSDSKVGFKGVSYNPYNDKYRAYIHVGGVRKNLGSYPTAIQAAKAYDVASLLHYGLDGYQNLGGEHAPPT